MENLARQEESLPIFQEIGTIAQCNDTDFIIASGSFQYRAQKATGCLLYPKKDDKVLFITSPSGECYIISVLETNKSTKQRLLFEGDTEVVCKNGTLDLAGQNGVNLASPKQVRLTTFHLKVFAEEGEASVSRLTFLGSFLLGKIASIKLLAGRMEFLCDRLQQKVKRSYRTVEDTDHLKAGKIDYNAERLMSLRGKYSMLTAEEDVKIDGERIHMG